MTDQYRDILLVIKHTQVPAKGEKTHMKDWKKTGKWMLYEEATVTDSIKKKLEQEASVIINVDKMKVEKNRFRDQPNNDDKTIYLSYMQKYQENIAQFFAKYRPEVLAALVRERAKQESIKKSEEEVNKSDV